MWQINQLTNNTNATVAWSDGQPLNTTRGPAGNSYTLVATGLGAILMTDLGWFEGSWAVSLNGVPWLYSGTGEMDLTINADRSFTASNGIPGQTNGFLTPDYLTFPPTWNDIANLNSEDPTDPDDAPPDLFNRRFMCWMSFLNPSATLTQLAIPGTHESATYSMRDYTSSSWPFVDPSTIAEFDSETQSFNLLGQLLNGIRYFDLRVEQQGGNGPLIFHHGSGPTIDCTGRVAETVIETQIAPFVLRYPSEFIIFDFQDVCNYVGNPAQGLASLQTTIANCLNAGAWAVPATSFAPGSLTLAQIRQNGWRFAVLVNDAAIQAAQDANPPIPVANWVIPRLPGNSSSPTAGVIWDPWIESVWNGDAGGIIAQLNQDAQTWQTSKRPGLYVAQALHTPTTGDSILELSPLYTEAMLPYQENGFNQWVAGLTQQSPPPPVNIVIRDAMDWFPETVANIIGLNIPLGNILAQAKPQLQILLNASQNAHASPVALTGTATAAWFSGGGGPPECQFVNEQQDNATLQNSNWCLTAGTPNLPGASYVFNNDVFDDSNDGAWNDWTVNPLPQGTVVSYFQLQALWTDGTDGWFRVNYGWVLQNQLQMHVNGYETRGTSWEFTVQTVSGFSPNSLFCDYSPSPALASNGSTLYMLMPGPNNTLYLTTSSNSGQTWTSVSELTSLYSGWVAPLTPSLTTDGSTLYMALPGLGNGIYITSSTDGGATWTPQANLSSLYNGWYAPLAPSLTCAGSTLYMALPGLGNVIYITSSSDGGQTWTPQGNLTPLYGGWVAPMAPSLTTDGSNLYMALPGLGNGVYITSSSDGGKTWTPQGNLTPLYSGWYAPLAPSLTCIGSTLYLALTGWGNEIYVTSSSDGGTTWTAQGNLSPLYGGWFVPTSPAVTVLGGTTPLLCMALPGTGSVMYFTSSTDGGATWLSSAIGPLNIS